MSPVFLLSRSREGAFLDVSQRKLVGISKSSGENKTIFVSGLFGLKVHLFLPFITRILLGDVQSPLANTPPPPGIPYQRAATVDYHFI